MWWIPICDPDDNIYSSNEIHGKLSKKYLDNFPEDRSTGDVKHPAPGIDVFPSEKKLKVISLAPVSRGRGSVQLKHSGR